jgi:DNA-binding cell septation regulator SpoVG
VTVSKSQDLRVRIDTFKAHSKNSLVGFADVTLVDVGLAIKGVGVHERDGSRWIALPSRSYTSGTEVKWTPVLDFDSKESRRRITDAILWALDEFTPSEPHREGDAK